MKKVRLFLLLLMAAMMPLAMFGQNTVTVNDGTATNSYVPVYGLYTDTQGSTSEFIIPSTAEGMDLLANGTISNLTFYLSTSASEAWTGTFQVYMAEVESTTLSAVVGPDACTVVYTGTLDATGTTMEITLDQPYTYQGGNLLIGTYVQVAGNYKSATFYGVSATGAGYHTHGSTNSAQNFMAKTTFTYSGGTVITCPKPTDLTCTAYTSTTATLAWTAGGEETSWTLEYSTNEDFTGATSVTVTGTPSKELTGLTAETVYYARVKAVCTAGTDESDWCNAATFMPSAQVTLTVHDGTTTNSYVPMYCGYFDDFTKSQFVIPATDLEDMVGGTISSIKYYTTSQSMPYTTVSSVDVFVMEVDNTSLSEYADKADGQLVHSGTVDFVSEGAGGACVITFSTPYVYNGGNLLIGSENTTDAGYKFIYFYGETVEGASIAASNGTSLEDVTTATQRNFIPKTTFTYLPGEGPSCAKPANMEVSNLTATSATITWTNPNEDAIAGYVLMLNDEEITGITAADLTYTFTDLTPNTPYVVKLRTVCTESDTSIWNTITFTTECPAAFVVTSENPFHEGFEGATVACWSLEQDEEADSWWVSEGANAYEGTHYAVAPFTPGNVTRLISPVLDLTQIANPVLSYQHFQAYYEEVSLDVLTVYYRTSETSEWVLLADFADSSYTYYVQETHELPEASATYQISFLATSNDGYNILLDDINITGEAIVEPCAVPTNVTVENNVVTWEGNAASYNVMVIVGEDTTTATVNTATYTIEGLEDGTEGTVAVQAVCAEDNISEWSEPVAFTFVGVGINNYGIQANIYPNPTTGNVTVESDAINADITVFDMFGKLMMTSKVASERTELDFNGFAPGVYMVRIANNNGTTTVKVVKE